MNQFISSLRRVRAISASISGRFFGVILALSCAGCVIVPIGAFSDDPYRPEVLQKLSQKNADRNLVRQTLGSPDASRFGGRYWFYANSRPTWGIIGGSSGGVFASDDEWLAVQFDDAGHVIFLERANIDKCLSNGMCRMDALVAASKSDDAAAKAYQVRADECAVYLFLEHLPWPARALPLKFSIDGRVQGLVNEKTFLFLTHPQGEISLAAYQLRIATKCVGGERLYIKAVKALDWSWETGEDLAPVNSAEGEAAIRTRRLALPD